MRLPQQQKIGRGIRSSADFIMQLLALDQLVAVKL
jgi:hypothetical protein